MGLPEWFLCGSVFTLVDVKICARYIMILFLVYIFVLQTAAICFYVVTLTSIKLLSLVIIFQPNVHYMTDKLNQWSVAIHPELLIWGSKIKFSVHILLGTLGMEVGTTG